VSRNQENRGGYSRACRLRPGHIARWPGLFVATDYCCFDAGGGLLAGAVVAPGVVFLVFAFVFFFGAAGSAVGA
jgi:hypothetical protein